MTEPPGHIVAMGGGGFSMEPENPLLDDFILRLTGKDCPRVCFVPTASGDAEGYITRFLDSMSAKRCEPAVLRLFKREEVDLHAFLLAQDVIYVGGGNTANMLAVWRVHAVDEALRAAWMRGAVLCGVSAGAICWFQASITDSFGGLVPLRDGLGLLAGSACPHYDGEVDRRPMYHRFVGGGLPGGYAMDDGTAVVFRGTAFIEAVGSRPSAKVYRVWRDGGRVVEEAFATRFLGPVIDGS